MKRTILVTLFAWGTNISIFLFSIYSMYRTGISITNLIVFFLGFFQCIGIIRFKKITLTIVGIELFLLALLMFGLFFPLPEERRALNFTFGVSIMAWFVSIVFLMGASGLCVSEAKKNGTDKLTAVER